MSLGVLVGAACLLVFIAVTMLVLGWRSGQEASPRIEQVVESIEGEGAAAVPRAAGRDVSPLLTRLLDRIGLSRKLQWMLLRSGMLLKPSELAAIGLVTAGIIGSVTTVLTHNAVIGGLVSGAGLVAPWLYVGYRIRCRRAALEGQLAEALDLIASSLRTGYSFMRALQVVINEMKPPITEELQWVLDEISVGIAMDEALERLAYRTQSKDVRLMVTAVQIQSQVGGNLAEILENTGRMIRDRFRLKQELNAVTAEGRLSAAILTALPVVMGIIVHLMSPGRGYQTNVADTGIG